MAVKNPTKVVSGMSAAATTKGYAGKFDSNGEIAMLTGVDDVYGGVLGETVTAADEAVSLEDGGILALYVGESVSIGDRLGNAASGKFMKNSNGRYMALEAGSDGSLIKAVEVPVGPFYAEIDLTGLATTGVQWSWANPTGKTILIKNVYAYITTKSTGAATLDVGATATSATTSSDILLDGLDVGTAAGIFDVTEDGGTNGKARQTLAAGKWVTVDNKADTSGMVGKLIIEYIFA